MKRWLVSETPVTPPQVQPPTPEWRASRDGLRMELVTAPEPPQKRPRGSAGREQVTPLVLDYVMKRLEQVETSLQESRAAEAEKDAVIETLKSRVIMAEGRLRALEVRATLIEVRLPFDIQRPGHGPPTPSSEVGDLDDYRL